jgi:hypothetical protein
MRARPTQIPLPHGVFKRAVIPHNEVQGVKKGEKSHMLLGDVLTYPDGHIRRGSKAERPRPSLLFKYKGKYYVSHMQQGAPTSDFRRLPDGPAPVSLRHFEGTYIFNSDWSGGTERPRLPRMVKVPVSTERRGSKPLAFRGERSK